MSFNDWVYFAEEFLEIKEAFALQKNNKIDRWVLRLDKTSGKFEPWRLGPETFEEDLDAFLACLDLTRAIEVVEARMKVKKDFIKRAIKDRVKMAKEAELKVKCKNWARYKGKNRPRCNNGNPCEYCLKLYLDNHPVGLV